MQCSFHFSASAVFHESQTATITVNYETPTASSTSINTGIQTEPSTKPLLRPSSHVESVATQTRPAPAPPFTHDRAREYPSTDNIFSYRALITDLQVALTYGSPSKNSERARPHSVRHALSQTNEPTVFRRQALIYDSQTTHVLESIQSRFSHNTYALSGHSAVRFEHKNLWSILKPEYDDKKPAASSEAIFGDDDLPAWQSTTRRKTPKKEPEVTSASFLEYSCKACRQSFVLTVSNVHWFLEKNLQVPKRCEQCRERQRIKQRASLEKTAKPARILEYPHASAKPWPKLYPPNQSTPSSNASSARSCIPEGKFWDCQSTSSESSCQSTTKPAARNYWTTANPAVYDTPFQQEEMFSSAQIRPSESHEDWKVNNLIPLLDTIYFPLDPLSWSCSLRAPATFSKFHPSDACDRHPHASLDT